MGYFIGISSTVRYIGRVFLTKVKEHIISVSRESLQMMDEYINIFHIYILNIHGFTQGDFDVFPMLQMISELTVL